MVYTISDIHGDLIKLNKMLELIDFSSEDHLYVLGDVIDRGNDSIKCLFKLHNMENVTILKGNHESMMEDYYNSNGMNRLWLGNGGYHTLSELERLKDKNVSETLDIIKTMKLYKLLEVNNNSFALVHAGLEFEDGNLTKTQWGDFMLWSRDFISDTEVGDGITVIFGHTPTKNIHGEHKIWHGTNKICIDCGAVFGGKLACLRLDDMEEFYVR